MRGAVGVAVGLALDRFGVGLAARRPQRLRRGISSRFFSFPHTFAWPPGDSDAFSPSILGGFGHMASPRGRTQSAQWRALVVVVVVVPYVSVTRWEV